MPWSGWCTIPTNGRTYHAIRGVGAAVDGRPLRVNDPVPMNAGADRHRVRLRRRAAPTAGRPDRPLLPQVRDIRRIGSAALDLCAVAAGAVDGYFEEGVQAWDVAAGGLIAREAGAQATRTAPIAGQPGLLVAGPALFDELGQALARIREAG